MRENPWLISPLFLNAAVRKETMFAASRRNLTWLDDRLVVLAAYSTALISSWLFMKYPWCLFYTNILVHSWFSSKRKDHKVDISIVLPVRSRAVCHLVFCFLCFFLVWVSVIFKIHLYPKHRFVNYIKVAA